MTSPKVSVIINTLDRIKFLPLALTALQRLRYPNFEVIVVDGPSKDGTEDYIRANWLPFVKFRKCPAPNLSVSRNIGLSAASGEIVVFTDDDGIPEPGWLDEIVKPYADPEVAAVGGFVRDHTGVSFQTKYIVSTRTSRSEVQIERSDELPECLPYAKKFPGVIGVNSSFRRKSIEAIGGFDEHYAYFLDETDVVSRLIDRGYKVTFAPKAEVHHKYAPSGMRNHEKRVTKWDQIISSTSYFCLKNSTSTHTTDESLSHIDWVIKQAQNDVYKSYYRQIISKIERDGLLDQIKNGKKTGILAASQPRQKMHFSETPDSSFKRFEKILSTEKRLRIALVSSLFPPRKCGGVAVFINDLAKALANAGHEVTVITQNENQGKHTVDWESCVWVHRISAKGELASKLRGSLEDNPLPSALQDYSLAVHAEISRMHEQRNFDLVVGTIWDCDLLATARLSKIPVATYLVTNYSLAAESKPEWRANSDFFENHVKKVIRAEKELLERSTYILTSTDAIRKDVERTLGITIPSEKLHKIPFGSPDIPLQKGQKRKGTHVLFVGRLEKRKGIGDLLAAASQIVEREPEVYFHIVGDNEITDAVDGNYMKNFKAKHFGAAWLDRVIFYGHVTDGEMLQHYMDSDIFVAPSEYESFGLIFLEAMRFSKPCIGTNIGGIPEIIDNGDNGILVPPNSPSSLRDALMSLISSESLRESMGIRARQRFMSTFTLASFEKRFLDFAISAKTHNFTKNT